MKESAALAYTLYQSCKRHTAAENKAKNVMRLSRHSRLVTALVALVTVLFMQLAVAAYACPGLQPQEVADTSAMQGMPGCEDAVDAVQPGLCHAHTQAGNQSLDKPPMPDVAPSAAIVLVPMINDIDIALRPISTHAEAPWLMRGSTPPLSVRNCCFRI